MLSRFRSHIGHNVVGYLALFFALTGVAYAAGPLKAGDPAGGDLTGTYPNPSIAQNAVDSGKVSNESLTGTDVDEASLGKVPDADNLDGLDSGNYGAVILGRVNGLPAASNYSFEVYGAPSGTSAADGTPSPVSAVTPDHTLKARDLSVKLTAPPGSGQNRGFVLYAGQTPVLGCRIDGTADSCTDSGPGVIPANSEIFVASSPIFSNATSGADARFAYRLTP